MQPNNEPDPVTTAAGLIVRPGDTLVIGLSSERLSLDDAARYREHVKKKLPGVDDVVVIGGCTALAAYRPRIEP